MRTLLALLLTMAPLPAAFAEAGGPDFFRVIRVAPDQVLNIRAEPSTDAAILGAIPADGDGIRNLGCKGGLSFAEWEKASEAEREAGERTRWCRIEYRDVEGWSAGRFLGEGAEPRN